MNNINHLSINSDLKTKSIGAFIFGIISILPSAYYIFGEVSLKLNILGMLDHFSYENFPLLGLAIGSMIFVFPGFSAILALILSVKGLILTKKHGSVSGSTPLIIFAIIFSIMGLLFWFFELFFIFSFASTSY